MAQGETRLNGELIAEQACSALQSIRKNTNPERETLQHGMAYQVFAGNRSEPTHYRLRVPGTNPVERWVTESYGRLLTCGIPYAAPSNLVAFTESFPDYWQPFLENTWHRWVGNPAIETDRKEMIERSPLFKADRIKAPLLVIHGAIDPRVKQSEADRIVTVLRDRGKPVEYLVAPDEGHGFNAASNRMAMAAAIEQFLAKHLGGRYQEKVRRGYANGLPGSGWM